MTKEETIIDFLKGLRIVLNNASAYSPTHPYFSKSVEDFKPRIDAVFPFLNPIKMGVTPNSLFMDEKSWEKAMLYEDLALMLHHRKIKSIEIKEGAGVSELVDFLSVISRPIKEILRQGGMQNIMKPDKTPHILVQELDYSEFLRSAGEDCKDIWVYLFKEAVQNNDLKKINEFAQNFKEIIGNFKARDLLEDEELRQNLHNFLEYLKDKGSDKFANCSKELFKFVLKGRNFPDNVEFGKVSQFFKYLSKEDLSEALLESISKDDNFDYLSFTTLSRLFEEDAHKEISGILEAKVKNAEYLKNSPKIRKKIRELFSTPEDLPILPFYRHALSVLSESNLTEGNLYFDHKQAKDNFRFLLLNLFVIEKDPVNLNLIEENVLKECNSIIEENNLKDLRLVYEAFEQRLGGADQLSRNLQDLEKAIFTFTESQIFQGQDLPDLGYFVDKARKSFLGVDYYIDNMFNKGTVNNHILRMLFKFYQDSLPVIVENLEKRHSDIDFLVCFIRGLECIDSRDAVEMLKKIFYISNDLVKIEVLKSMRKLTVRDPDFLFSNLKDSPLLLKKEALLALVDDEKNKIEALDMLFSMPSRFGKSNKVILENMLAVEDIQLTGAKDHLLSLAKRPFFWNSNIRNKAREILRRWGVS